MTISWDNGDQHSDWMDYHIDRETKVAENTKRQELEDTVTTTLKERGASDSTIAAFRYHIGNESSWNPGLRHGDQPRYGGEAHFAHGLLSEGGPEWEPMYKYAAKHGTSWNDPRTQINFAVDNLQSRGLWEKMQSGSKEEAASTMLSGYLRPAPRYQVAREQAIRSGSMDTDPLGEKGAGSMPYLNKGSYINPETGRPHITVEKYPSYENAVIDHDHDVPLVAGALMNNDGDVIGSSYSRLLPRYADIMGHTMDMFEGVHYHEMAEVQHMEENLLPTGMPSDKAYKQAHDNVATPTEQNWVMGEAKKLGKDPDEFWKAYQDHWKNMAKITENAKPEKVHSDLYLHPYQGHKFQADMEKLSGRTIDQHPGAKTREAAKEYLPRKPEGYPQQKSKTKGVYTADDYSRSRYNPSDYEEGRTQTTVPKMLEQHPGLSNIDYDKMPISENVEDRQDITEPPIKPGELNMFEGAKWLPDPEGDIRKAHPELGELSKAAGFKDMDRPLEPIEDRSYLIDRLQREEVLKELGLKRLKEKKVKDLLKKAKATGLRYGPYIGSMPEAANMNKPGGGQIPMSRYQEELLNQSWDKLGKKLNPPPKLDIVE